ncbi:hypothetical protein B0H16DRAFT_1326584 [Mycena metata]|uniref:Uncharacterized protein n=1 Tax=Mycena metata TaxID=1033252 RepID=A0AAD7I8J0_9AGAR|nr:hypothetical protein B0H16DRAFT_1326584 [Mycena metata]
MSKFLGLPSASAIRRSDPPRLLPSIAAPTAAEIATNITTFFGPPPPPTAETCDIAPISKVGHCLMLDGIHLCQRCRWHRPTNQIIGLCREHSGHLDLSMNTMDSVLTAVDAVHGESPTCHYGREATVVAVGAFRPENYHALPIMQAQTCKSEKGKGFGDILESVLEQWKIHGAPHHGDVWVVSFDGDSVFREGGFKVLMCNEVDPESPLGKKLAGMPGLNKRCGKNNEVMGPDPKHFSKRGATLERSNEGIVIDRVVLNRSIITQWLERLPDQTKESVAILVDPADHQNVPRAYKLMRACISLGSLDVPPMDHGTRRAFALAGEMWKAFLDPFTDGTLSLSESLSSLSKFAHLAFVFYRMHGSSFLSNQLYGDLQALVKAAFFAVAQQQILDPKMRFYLYQIGSDRLEEMFAEVRTESHDSNVDALQLSERLSDAADSVGIFNNHPEWHQGHVRRSWSGKEADHVNPTFYTADMVVGNVVNHQAWTLGGTAAYRFLLEHGIDFDFEAALSVPGVDFLCPNGGNIYPGVSREKDRSIIEDKTNDILAPPPSLQTEDIEPFLPEEAAQTIFLDDLLPDEPSPSASNNNDWLDYPLDNGSTKRLHKASILRTLFTSDFSRLATTRLLRVRCYTADGHKPPTLNHLEISGEYSFNVGDLAVALIRSDKTVAAGIVRVTVLEKNKVRVGQVDVEDLGSAESQVSPSLTTCYPPIYTESQLLIMRDVYVVGAGGAESTRKWIWSGDYGNFEALNGAASTVELGTRKALTLKIPGALLHPLDAEVESISVLPSADQLAMHAKKFTQTWAVSNDDLAAVVAAMYERLDVATLLQVLPKHGKSEMFPYIRYTRVSAFVLENATQTLAQTQRDESERISCFQCHQLIKPEDARAHVGGHIIRATSGVQETLLVERIALPDPCGFCGRSGCSVDIEKNGKTLKATSSCPRQHAFAYGHAKKYSVATPCTNVPIICALCPIHPPRKFPPVFWKYSILHHIQDVHPRHMDEFGVPCDLDPDFANKIALSREELTAFNIALGLSSAPSAQSLVGVPVRGTKRTLNNVTNTEASASGSTAKRQKK